MSQRKDMERNDSSTGWYRSGPQLMTWMRCWQLQKLRAPQPWQRTRTPHEVLGFGMRQEGPQSSDPNNGPQWDNGQKPDKNPQKPAKTDKNRKIVSSMYHQCIIMKPLVLCHLCHLDLDDLVRTSWATPGRPALCFGPTCWTRRGRPNGRRRRSRSRRRGSAWGGTQRNQIKIMAFSWWIYEWFMTLWMISVDLTHVIPFFLIFQYFSCDFDVISCSLSECALCVSLRGSRIPKSKTCRRFFFYSWWGREIIRMWVLRSKHMQTMWHRQ